MLTSLVSVHTVLPFFNSEVKFGQVAYQANGNLETSHRVCVSVTYSASVRFEDTDKQFIHLFICLFTDMRRLTTEIRSEKCVVRLFHRCANVIQCTYTNLDSTV